MENSEKQHLIFLMADLHLWGGGERVAVLMANHYAANEVETTLLSVGIPGGDFRFEIDPRVKVDYLNIPLERGWDFFRKIEAIIAIREYFRTTKTEPTTKDLSNPGGNTFTMLLAIGNFPIILAALVPIGKHLRTIGCLHTPDKSIRHIWKLLRWLLYGRLDILVSLTHRNVPLMKRYHPNVRVIPNPITFYPEVAANLENKLILAIGRMDYFKGYDLMIEVFDLFCRKNNDWKLKIVGEGPIKSDIEKLVKKKGLSDRLTIAPATADIEKEYLAASIFLMTSRSEGLPMVLLEAQACGLPIVAFDCETGPAEVITHYADELQIHPSKGRSDGFLVRPFDIDEMCARLDELVSNPDLRKSLGLNARQNVRRFFPEAIYQKWDLLFNELMAERHSDSGPSFRT